MSEGAKLEFYYIKSYQLWQQTLDEAINKLSLDFQMPLGKQDYEILKQTYENFQADDPKEEKVLDLLHGLYILEYRNHDLWYDVHPIVIKILQKNNIIWTPLTLLFKGRNSQKLVEKSPLLRGI